MSSVHSKDKQIFKSDLVESQETSRPSSASEAVEAEQSPHHDEEKAIDTIHATEAPFDTRSVKTNKTIESVIPSPPDGGLHAWLKVFGGFMIYVSLYPIHIQSSNHAHVPQINIWGFTLSYGAFQAYYKSDLLSSASPSAISWIGTVQAWLLIFFGVLSGPLFDLGYFRVMLMAGNFLVVFGIMMLSLSTQYWQVFLSQGICGVVYIIMFDRLLKSSGFPWAMRAIGFVALAAAIMSIPALLSGSSVLATKRKARSLFDKTAYKDKLFLIFTCCSFSTFLGYIVPYFYIPTYARDRLGLSQSTGLYTLVMAIAASFFGRLMSGALAQWLGPIDSSPPL
ncbi:hypothetical protein SLS59_000040 [Nothophoma quercina]|uniref:MFS general substrate transporter n=1 Tax=Nothophoma quercina TaxID=749835 RepID=A0ABR3S517_9PLEO